MVKKTLLIILSILILTQLVLAMPTEIKVKTLPYNEVIVSIIKSGQVIERFNGTSNYFGDISFKYSSPSKTFDMYVQVRNLKETLYFESYPDTEAGDPIVLDLYPSDFVFPEPINRENKQSPITGDAVLASNSTTQNETNISTPPVTSVQTTNSSTKKKSWFTNFAISDENGNINISLKTIYYILGVVVVLVLVFLLIRRGIKRRGDNPYYSSSRSGNSDIKVRKLSELGSEEDSASLHSKDLVKAEKRLREAEAEINRMKNQDKIDSIQKKIEEQQRELRRLQRG